jgi:hypothetical protein
VEPLHYMLPEDEIFLCGMVLLYGVVIGVAARLVYALLGRRSA